MLISSSLRDTLGGREAAVDARSRRYVLKYHPTDPIAALATPQGHGALAVIRCTGEKCVGVCAPAFSRPEALTNASGHTAVHGHMRDPESGELLDEVVVVVYRAPRSYTGEESLEITCHGGLPGVRAQLDVLYRLGFREAEPGEFTLRAFLNGRIDLPEAEAVREIIEAKTERAHSMAVRRLVGDASRRFEGIRASITDLLAPVELALDYPEEETGIEQEGEPFAIAAARALIEEIDMLLEGFRIGKLYQDGIRVVIAGATNAGKSSLFNRLVREDRAIVSEEHGTTRDYIESWLSIHGVPVRLFDTAGLRDVAAGVESEGIRRAESLLTEADLVLYLVDATVGVTEADERLLARLDPDRTIKLFSKSDLVGGVAPDGFVAVSAMSGAGIPAIEDAILSHVGEPAVNDGAIYLESDHQKRCLSRCREALLRAVEASESGYPLDAIATDLGEAACAIGELTGAVTRADVLDAIFSRFCVGK